MPAHRNIHRTEQDWLQILRDYENCGLTQKQFCQQNNLAFSTFTKWKSQLSTGSLYSPDFLAVNAVPMDEVSNHTLRFELCLTWFNKLHCSVKFG